jgi:glycogen debranching enzyme
MLGDTVSILEGDTFVVSNRQGDLDGTPTLPHGLFRSDTRFLSRWILTIDGRRPNALSVDDVHYSSAQFFLVPGTGTVYVDAPLSVIRTREIGNGFHEEIRVVNHSKDPADLVLRLEAGADFADLFEVKDALTKKGRQYARVEPDRLVLGYRREKFVRETWIMPSASATIDEGGLSFAVHIEPQGEWSTQIDVGVLADSWRTTPEPVKTRSRADAPRPAGGTNLAKWLEDAPALEASWPALKRIYLKSLTDLAALRYYPRVAPQLALPAAGLPWFMTLFGRDSILTSLQSLPYTPELAETTLMLHMLQGVTVDDFRDEEPGKILHEMRWGELTAFEERPHSPYYGSCDATPLYLILLDEYERWTGNGQLVRDVESPARAALAWIDQFGDRDGDGYVEYERRNKKTGLENQCWKDSWNSIVFANGELAKLPRATCEIQGYVYDAKMRCARLARTFWNDPALADKLERQAADLKARFNKDFWVEDGGFFALALDGDKRQVDSLTSNIGHLLWSGIVEKDKAKKCVEHLMSDRLFSGWGVRTMASNMRAYNPIGYHVGTVWPHDNSFIAAGLRRYGYDAEAASVSLGILEAAEFFNSRLPEAFAGYPREMTRFPVEYPTACSPQAWATGAPLLLITTMLGIQPVGEKLLTDPAIPVAIERIELLGVRGRWGHSDAAGRGRLKTAMKDVRLSAA